MESAQQAQINDTQIGDVQFKSKDAIVEQLPYKYYGNNFSHKFHRPDCPFGMCISKRHLVLFHFRKEAIDANYKPCRYCLPPVWRSVHSVILPQAGSNIDVNRKVQHDQSK